MAKVFFLSEAVISILKEFLCHLCGYFSVVIIQCSLLNRSFKDRQYYFGNSGLSEEALRLAILLQ